MRTEPDISSADYAEAVSKVISTGQYILGPEVTAFETRMKAFLNVKHAIGVGNGTDALVLAMDALGIGQGDEVITTPYTFFASAETICRVGAVPVFADVLEDTYNMDPEKMESLITPKTKAIMVVHIFGNPVDMKPIKAIADRHNLFIIEDACQAIGASYDGVMAGSLGDVACFSFFPTKNLGAFGDGGLITTHRDEVAEKIRMLRFHGQKVKYKNEILGYNSRLDEIQAAILNVKLPYLIKWNNRRRALAQKYNEALKDIQGVTTPVETPKGLSVYHIYSIMAERRDELGRYLEELGIGTGVYYAIPLHLQQALSSLGYSTGAFPVSEKLSGKALALPMYPSLTDEEQERVIDAIQSFYKR